MDKIKRIRYEISGILSVVSGLIVFISLVTHYQWDPSPATTATDARNLLGIFGSYVSDILLQAVGFTAYIVPVLLCIFGIRKILGKQGRHKPAAAAVVMLILIVSMSSLFTLVLKDPSGGILGSVSTRISLKLLSTTGSYLLFVPLTFVTIMFLTPFSITDFAREIRKKAVIPRIQVPFKNKNKKKKKETEQPHIEESEPVQAAPYKQAPLPLVYPAEIKQRAERKANGEYEIPSIELLQDPQPVKSKPSKDELLASSELLANKLKDFSVDGSVTHVTPGPVVTMFEFEPAPGVKINRVLSLADDLALPLKTTSLRISPIPGKSTLGIEVPNRERETVYLKEMLDSEAFRKSSSKLTLALGKNIFGVPVVADLARMPHLLIAGATGAGKSVGINVMVLSLLYRATPKEVKMLMIDPKMLELPLYEEIPHLMLPIITSPKDAADALKSMVHEMERRYKLLAKAGSRNIETYNRKIKSSPDTELEPLPYIIIFIDEFADVMLVSAQEVENSIARLAQMARASGIHLILATQRPSVDVITGVIKANFSSRISFHVSSKLDSRIILDTYGADKLLGKGDMLYITPGSRISRIHGAYVTEEEIKIIVDFIKAQGPPDYTILEELAAEELAISSQEDRDELYHQACEIVIAAEQASISYIQRRLKIGYNRAASIMEMMEEDGIVGPPGEAGKPREILRRRR